MRDPTDSLPIDQFHTQAAPIAPDPTTGAPITPITPTATPATPADLAAAPSPTPAPDSDGLFGQEAPTTAPYPPPDASGAGLGAAPDSASNDAYAAPSANLPMATGATPYGSAYGSAASGGYATSGGYAGGASGSASGRGSQGASRSAAAGRRSAGWVATTLLAIFMLVIGTALGVGLVKTSPTTFSGLTLPGVHHSAPTGAHSTTPQAQVGTPAPTVVVPPSATDLQQTVIAVVRTVQPSVVEIQSVGPQGNAIGSGEIVSADGYIVTNDHVVATYQSYNVTLSNGQSYPAQVAGQDAADDLAVIKISAPTKLQPINFGDSNKVQVGEFVLALGNPLGLQQSATFGIISALNRSASEAPNGPAGTLTGLIQTSAPINPGNSGGALVDLQGNLIGVPTLGATDPSSGSGADGIGFAIPSDRVQFVETQLIKYGKVTNTNQGFLGIQGEDVTPQLAAADNLSVQSGVLVTGFADDAAGASPAQQAGLKIGDIIVGANSQTVNVNSDLSSILQTDMPGAQVTVQVVRGTTQLTITVTLGERPANLNG